MSAGGPTFIHNPVPNNNPVIACVARILPICEKITVTLENCANERKYSGKRTNFKKKRLMNTAGIDCVHTGEIGIAVSNQEHIEFNKTVARPSKPDFKFRHKKVTQKAYVPEPINARKLRPFRLLFAEKIIEL